MALVYCESFGAANDLTSLSAKGWNGGFGGFATAVGGGSGRRGQNSLNINTNGTGSFSFPSLAHPVPSGATCIFGFGWKLGAFNAQNLIMGIAQAGLAQFELRNNASGSFSITRNGTTLGTSAIGLYTTGVWHYIECKVLIDPTVGTYEVKLDGVSVLSGSGANTRNTGSSTWNGFYCNYTASSNITMGSYCDMYFCDASGSFNNDYLGDVRVDPQFPTNNGTYNDSTPSTGVNRALTIDEAPPNTSDFNTLANVNDKDSLQHQALLAAGVGTVLGYQTSIYAYKTDAGSASIAEFTRSGGSDFAGTGVPLTNSGTYAIVNAHDTDPNTGARFTESNFNSAEFGYKKTL